MAQASPPVFDKASAQSKGFAPSAARHRQECLCHYDAPMPASDATSSAPVGVALVGLAGYGEAYLKAILPDAGRRVRLVAGVDPRASASAFHDALRGRDVPIYDTIDALWADDAVARQVELVCLATPIHLHRAMTIDALSRGRHVLCEKPLAGDVAESLAIQTAAAAHADRVVAVGYQWSFSDAIGRLKRDAIAGRFGAATRFRTLLTMPRPVDYFLRNRWAGRCLTDDGAPVYDSPANNAAAHHLHNMLYVGGSRIDRSATPRFVTAELARANAIENYDTAAIRVETAEGVEILFYTSHATTRKLGPLAHFEFERADVRYNGDGSVVATMRDGGETIDYGNPDADKFEKLWQTAAAIRDASRRPVVCGVEAALPHAQVVAAAQRSMPVADVPAAYADLDVIDNERFRVIRGVAESLEQAHDRGALPGACGVAPWLNGTARRVAVDETIENESNPASAAPSASRRFEGVA